MNANRLLAHYERIADAPDAIARLRRFILDLAVRGKLVEQDPNDEPAPELLKRIAKDKAHLVKARKISKQVSFQPRDLSEAPFNLPGSWDWCPSTYPSYIVSGRGKNIQTKDVVETGNFPVVDQGKMLIRGYHNDASKVIRVKEPIVLFGDHTRETKLIDFDFVVGADGVKLLHPVSLHTAYYFLALQWLPLESRGYGRHFKLLKASFIPLPPLAEQHRIVAKVDELMGLCDRLETARTEREATRDRMATASLIRLNDPDPDPEVFRNHAAFALENLTPLTTRRDQIKALRQTILNLAVRGKLVAQDPNDEPASELLDKIEAKRKTLYAAKLIPKPKTLPLLEDMANLFLLPEGWMWSMLGELCYQVADGPHFSPQYVPAGEGVPFLSTRNVRSDGFDLTSVKYVSRKDHEEFCKRIRPEKHDIIYTKGGTTGIAKLNDLDMEFSVWVHLAVLRIDKEWLFPRYLEMALNSPHCYEQSQQYTQGISNFDLGLTRMIKITAPLPPLAEQHRIVARVDELMALCDRLETSFTTGDDTRRRLLDALLHEVLVMGADRKSVA